MTWVRIDDQFPMNPKVVKAGARAAWLYVAALCYSSAQLTDGRIPKVAVARLTDLAGSAKLAERLVEVGLWAEDGDAYVIHDYHEYNPTAAKVREQRRAKNEAKVQAGRAGGIESGKQRRSKGEAEPKQTGSETEAPPHPTPSVITSTPLQTLGVPSPVANRGERVDEALRSLALREYGVAPPGSIRSQSAWLAKVVESNRVLHGGVLHRLAHENPTWTPDELADATAVNAAPILTVVPTRPICEICHAHSDLLVECPRASDDCPVTFSTALAESVHNHPARVAE